MIEASTLPRTAYRVFENLCPCVFVCETGASMAAVWILHARRTRASLRARVLSNHVILPLRPVGSGDEESLLCHNYVHWEVKAARVLPNPSEAGKELARRLADSLQSVVLVVHHIDDATS